MMLPGVVGTGRWPPCRVPAPRCRKNALLTPRIGYDTRALRKADKMQDRSMIQAYINNFRRHLSRYLRPQVGLSANIYPVEQQGAILEFRLGPNIANEDRYGPVHTTVNDALPDLNQHAFGGNLGGFNFGGTNIVLEPDRVILINGGDSPSEWSDQGAAGDVRRLVSGLGAPKAP